MNEDHGKKLIAAFGSPEWNRERERLQAALQDAAMDLAGHAGPVGRITIGADQRCPYSVTVTLGETK